MASAPIVSDGCKSVSGCQVTPPSVVFHTPPWAPPMKTVLPVASVGSIAIAATLPEVLPDDPTRLLAAGTLGCGPIGRHVPGNGARRDCARERGAALVVPFASWRAIQLNEKAKQKTKTVKARRKINIFRLRILRVGIF